MSLGYSYVFSSPSYAAAPIASFATSTLLISFSDILDSLPLSFTVFASILLPVTFISPLYSLNSPLSTLYIIFDVGFVSLLNFKLTDICTPYSVNVGYDPVSVIVGSTNFSLSIFFSSYVLIPTFLLFFSSHALTFEFFVNFNFISLSVTS